MDVETSAPALTVSVRGAAVREGRRRRRNADMRKVKKLPRAAFWGEKFPQKCVIHDCFQFTTKGHISDF